MIGLFSRLILDRRPRTETSVNRLLISRLKNAIIHVPFYRDIARTAGIDSDNIQTLADFDEFPVIDSRDYRAAQQANGQDYLIDQRFVEHARYIQKSSGSTGEPLVLKRTKSEHYTNIAKTIMTLQRSGLKPWGKTLAFVTSDRIVKSDSILQKLGIYRRKTVSFEQSPIEIAKMVRDERFDCLYGTRAHVEIIAEAALENDIELSVRTVLIGSEVITNRARHTIQKGLNPKIFGEWYGSMETGIIAHKISERYHVLNRTIDMRIDRKSGDLLLNSLFMQAQPILKYRIGDKITEPDFNTTGAITSFASVLGRDNDYVRTRTGKIWSGTMLYTLVESSPGVIRFRIDQHAPGKLDIHVKFSQNTGQDFMHILTDRMQELTGNEFDFKIHPEDDLGPLPTGKFAVVRRLYSSEEM